MMMHPEAMEAIQIADKHLGFGASVDRRKALALDIHAAILRRAETIAVELIKEAVAQAGRPAHTEAAGQS